MRVLVFGRSGQVAQSLLERGQTYGCEVIAMGRPETDLSKLNSVVAAVKAVAPDVVVNAAAYTAVDNAEKEAAMAAAVNAAGAAHVAAAAAAADLPIIQLSTDYVFDGSLDRPYRENDPTGPVNVYGSSKLEGETAVAEATANHVILRTSWVYSPFGTNFVKTMLNLAANRDQISVIGDTLGNPTFAPDIADGILAVARNLLTHRTQAIRGTFHMTGASETNWASFASAIFEASKAQGGPFAQVKHIATRDYPTAARRPVNSRLNSGNLALIHHVRLPSWQASLTGCVARLLEDAKS